MQANGGDSETAETTNEKDLAKSWVCLAQSLIDLLLSTPARTRTDLRLTKENTRKVAVWGSAVLRPVLRKWRSVTKNGRCSMLGEHRMVKLV